MKIQLLYLENGTYYVNSIFSPGSLDTLSRWIIKAVSMQMQN